MGSGGEILTTNELIFTFADFYVYANFGRNWSRNWTVRVHTDGQIHILMHISFIICPMPYAIAVGQIITRLECG